MGLANSLLKSQPRLTKISIDDIVPNKLNKYTVENIEELAYLIEIRGQLEPLIVYQDDSTGRYTLLSGERRYGAIKLLKEQNRGDGMANVYIYAKPKDEFEELEIIQIANSYRTKSPDDIFKEVMDSEKYYNYLCEKGQTPEGLKRDWIGKHCGMSGRRAEDYYKGRKVSVSEEVKQAYIEEPEKPKKEEKPKDIKDVVKLYEKAEKQIEKAMQMAEEIGEDAVYHDISYTLNKVRESLYPLKERVGK